MILSTAIIGNTSWRNLRCWCFESCRFY